MKVLIVHPGPAFSVADVYNGLARGLRECGVEVAMFNLDERITFYTQAKIERNGELGYAFDEEAAMAMAAQGLEVACYEFWPDLVIIVSGFYIPPKVWGVFSRRPHRVVLWGTESPYEDDRQARPGRYADLVVLNDPTNLEGFRQTVNPQTYYFPHSYDPAIHHPGPAVQSYKSDFAFVGTGFPSRIEWLERVDWSGIDALIGGNWQGLTPNSPLLRYLAHEQTQCMDNTVTADVYRSTKASLNLYRKEHSEEGHADGWAMGPREVELAACGTFFFREPRGEGDGLFPMLPVVPEPEEFGDALRWWLANDDARIAASTAAQAAIADRTFKNSAAKLLRLVEGLGRKVAA